MRGKNFTDGERFTILRLLSQGRTIRQIAAQIGRGKSSVQRQIAAMRRDGLIADVSTEGQADGDE